jgi:hypothetical protein
MAAVVDQGQPEGGLVLQVRAEFAPNHDPTCLLSNHRVALEKHRFADSSETGDPDVAWEFRETA